jgi:hypothetical protein
MTNVCTPRPAGTGPWATRTCVTAACTRCGAAPLDDGTGITPTSPASVRQQRNWCASEERR